MILSLCFVLVELFPSPLSDSFTHPTASHSIFTSHGFYYLTPPLRPLIPSHNSLFMMSLDDNEYSTHINKN